MIDKNCLFYLDECIILGQLPEPGILEQDAEEMWYVKKFDITIQIESKIYDLKDCIRTTILQPNGSFKKAILCDYYELV